MSAPQTSTLRQGADQAMSVYRFDNLTSNTLATRLVHAFIPSHQVEIYLLRDMSDNGTNQNQHKDASGPSKEPQGS
jgi:hypothetical protein